MSPIYLWQSGLPQVHHITAAMAMGVYVLGRPRIRWRSWWKFGVGFVLYTLIVNLVVFSLYGDTSSLLAPIYYTFDFLVFTLLVNISQEARRPFLFNVFWIHVALFVIIVALCMSGHARLYGEGRIMGSFNDPNQMGNWFLWATIIIGVTGRAIYRSWLPGALATGLATLALVFTASRSTTLGLLTLLGIYTLMGLHCLLRIMLTAKIRVSMAKTLPLAIVAVVVVMIGIAGVSWRDQQEWLVDQAAFLVARFQEVDPYIILEERGYDRIWKFPEYLVFGAGEGAHWRYAERTWFLGEIHSNWAGLLFNYGILGSSFFFGFLYHLLRRIRLLWFKLMLVAPFVYGFFTYGLRNWYFWIGLALVYASSDFIMMREASR